MGADKIKAQKSDYGSLFRLSNESIERLISGEATLSKDQLYDFKEMAADNKLLELSDKFKAAYNS